MPDPDCPFCKIVAGEIPAAKVHEDDLTVAFMDINPTTRGHLLVVPREHSVDVHGIEPDDLAAVARTAKLMAGRVVERLGAEGVNIVQNNGRRAGQVVFHYHTHVLPRYGDDGLRLPFRPSPADPDELASLARELAG